MIPRRKMLGALVGMMALSCCLAIPTGTASAGDVRPCKPFVVAKSGAGGIRAYEVRRSRHLTCSKARKLLKAAYGLGPLEVVRVVQPKVGRPTYWLRDGWRCGNGAGGAACRNARRPDLNAIDNYGYPVAVIASVR